VPQDMSAPLARGCLPPAGGRYAPPPNCETPQGGDQSCGGKKRAALPPPANSVLQALS